MKRTPLPDDVKRALAAADRTPGWSMRSRDVRRFALGGCMLIVVPFRRWAYRRIELQAEAWRREQGQTA
jgi:hypothetical protein